MTIRLGDTAPNFQIATTNGDIDFHEFIGENWVYFFSHPADFTPVCTTEIAMTAQLSGEFAKRNVKPIGLSTDNVENHSRWILDVNEVGDTEVHFPLIADENLVVARLYDMIHPNVSETVTVRSVFIIDPNKKVRLTLTYPMQVGRNFDEILRIIDALQTVDNHKVSTPANWVPGGRVIVPPTIPTQKALETYKDVEVKKPYLRYASV